jgi:hypothetical protein
VSSKRNRELKLRVGSGERVQVLVGESLAGEAVRHALGWRVDAADGQQHEVVTLDGALVRLGVLAPDHLDTPADHPEVEPPDDEGEIAR